MTYPPQQPGPYGQQPDNSGGYGYQQQPGGYGQPDPYTQQTQYQGLGGFPGGPPPPPKSSTGKIVAVVVIALLVLGGAGVGVYFLTKDSGNTTAGPEQTSSAAPPETETSQRTTTSRRTTSSAPDTAGPQEVVDAYVRAYETKQFSSVTTQACDAYKKKYGTDTTELEGKLADFDITAKASGEPKVTGSSATAEIDLTLTKGTESKDASIRIKIVKESGDWKFCGEEAA